MLRQEIEKKNDKKHVGRDFEVSKKDINRERFVGSDASNGISSETAMVPPFEWKIHPQAVGVFDVCQGCFFPSVSQDFMCRSE
jgi:hypothetical protein